MAPKIFAIIQARMGSTRLPGKVLKPIMGKPMLWYLISRLKNVPGLNDIIVATSTNKKDDEIEKFCLHENINMYRGSENDVLDRFYQAATIKKAEHIIRITADCPLIDPMVVQRMIDVYLEKQYEYFSVATGAGVANKDFSGRFPDGLDAEIFSYSLLKNAWEQAISPLHREHVTPFIWQQPDRFKIGNLKSDIDYSNLRWTVDNEADFELVSWIYENLYLVKPSFDMNDILELLRTNPDKSKINQHFIGKEKYDELWKK
jgi:spore coat polysaccharide biosynthesis protein SpsF